MSRDDMRWGLGEGRRERKELRGGAEDHLPARAACKQSLCVRALTEEKKAKKGKMCVFGGCRS